MGGRGASSGYSIKGRKYGSEYKTLHTEGNIKFVRRTSNSSEILVETMTPNRVYAIVGNKNTITAIHFMGRDLKRTKSIELNHSHKGLSPHVHHGYEHNEWDGKKGATKLTIKELKMVDKVLKTWDNIK